MKLGIIFQWLAVLACPLMMLWCMRGMLGRGQKHDQPGDEDATTRTPASGDPEDEIRALKARLARLEAQRSAASMSDQP